MKVTKVTILCVFLINVLGYGAHTVDDDIAFGAGQHEHPNPLFGEAKPTRYLLYEVNPGEGFNLRRDVYMRVANMVKFLMENEEEGPWVIVLPPWGPMYHWKNKEIVEQKALPWSLFFDIESLRKYVPVMEFTDFLKMQKKPVKIDDVYYLQRFAEGWIDGKWSTRIEERECIVKSGFEQMAVTGLPLISTPSYMYITSAPFYFSCFNLKDDDGEWRWHFWGHGNEVSARNFKCVSVQADIEYFSQFLHKNFTGRPANSTASRLLDMGDAVEKFDVPG